MICKCLQLSLKCSMQLVVFPLITPVKHPDSFKAKRLLCASTLTHVEVCHSYQDYPKSHWKVKNLPFLIDNDSVDTAVRS